MQIIYVQIDKVKLKLICFVSILFDLHCVGTNTLLLIDISDLFSISSKCYVYI